MFMTRRALKARISELEEKYNALLKCSELKSNSGLAECKGIVCKSCEHAVSVPCSWGTQLVGCDVTVNCKDYKRKTIA